MIGAKTNDILLALAGFFCLSAFISFLVLKLGRRVLPVDLPNERSSHLTPTLRGGGVGVVITFIVANTYYGGDLRLSVMAAVVGLLGFMEDRLELSSVLRLLVQFIISAVVVLWLRGQPETFSTLLMAVFWTVFIVATMNFYNFMDGINGMSALTGFVSFGFVAVFVISLRHETSVPMVLLAVAVACIGFLPFNFPKAKMFMGDVGSLLLGFLFGVTVMQFSIGFGVFICLIMFLSTFYLDALVTIYFRWRKKEPLLKAHRKHLYQYLSNELAIPHWKVSLLYMVVQILIGCIALLFYKKGLSWQLVFSAFCGLVFIVGYYSIKRIKPRRS